MTDIVYEKGDTLSAFFDSRSEAESAAQRLRSAGIPQDRIRIEGRDRETGEPTGETGSGATGSSTATGTTRTGDGSQTGLETGAGQGYGAHGGSRGLDDYYISDEDRHSYSEGISRGGFVVFVTDPDSTLRDEVFDIFETSGAVDFDERERSWRDEGWTGYSGSSSDRSATHGAGYGSGATSSSAQAGFAEAGSRFSGREGTSSSGEETIPVVEEQLRVGKRDRSHGRVRVRSYTREEPVSEDVTLRDEHVEIERRPADRAAGSVGDDAFRDRTIEAEERSEEAVIDKQARVTEEVGIRKESDTRHETVSDTVRHTEVDVERDDDKTRR